MFAAAGALPYAAFALSWALVFRTAAHVRWTLVYPVFSGMSHEIATGITAADVHESLVLALPLAALVLAAGAWTDARRLRSPLVAVALATVGMAWPRFGLLHLAGAIGLAALAACRALLVLRTAVLRAGVRPAQTTAARTLTLGLSAAALAIVFGVAVLGAGPLALDAAGGPLFFWDDSTTTALADAARVRAAPGSEMFVFEPHQTLYPRTGTLSPGGFYVNPGFWYCLARDRGDERLVAALAARPGLPVLFREPPADVEAVHATRTYAFLVSRTEPDGPAPGAASWRRVAGHP